MTTADARKLVYKFAQLPYHRQLEIGMGLKVIPRKFLDMRRQQVVDYIFRAVKKKKLVNSMWERVFSMKQS